MSSVCRFATRSCLYFCSNIEEEIVSLNAFTADMIYQAVLGCVETIKNSNCDVPRKLPPGMSQKFRAGSSLAALVTVSLQIHTYRYVFVHIHIYTLYVYIQLTRCL